MFEFLKTLTTRLHAALCRCTETATCHHALYGYLALTYACGCAGLIGKDLTGELAAAIYFALSIRG